MSHSSPEEEIHYTHIVISIKDGIIMKCPICKKHEIEEIPGSRRMINGKERATFNCPDCGKVPVQF
jgi:transposase-like protein